MILLIMIFFPFFSYLLPLRPNNSDSNLFSTQEDVGLPVTEEIKLMWVQIYFFSSHRDRPGTCPQLHKVYRQHSIQKAFTGTNVSSVSPIEYKCIILSDNSRYCFIHTGTVPDRARSYIKCIVCIRFRTPSQAQTSRQFRPSSTSALFYLTTRVTASFIRCRRFSDLP